MTDNPLKDEDFEAIEAAVLETARGRWFLAEYARRQRLLETANLSKQLEQMERRLLAHRSSEDLARVQVELVDLGRTISQARQDVLTAFGVTKSKGSEAPRAGESRAAAAQRAAQALRYLENRVEILVGNGAVAVPDLATSSTVEPPETSSAPEAELETEDFAANPASTLAEDDVATGSGQAPADAEVAAPAAQRAGNGEDEDDLFADDAVAAAPPAEQVTPVPPRPDNHEHLATTLRAAIAQVRGPSSDIDALSFEAKSVLFA
jgi:hypothetical protein